jgi:D-glycero-D-manno-heptose 1,7-bisphosphate phosphatase
MGNEHRGRAVFLDRDGVVNRALVRDGRPYPPASAEDVVLTDGAVEALRRLKDAGCLLVVVTNQPDVARGRQSREAVEAIHRWIASRTPIDDFRACYHDDSDGCVCRKPAPGLLLAAAAEHGIDLGRAVMVGDRWRDVEAGRRAGCATVFVDHGYAERRPPAPDAVVDSLPSAVEWILDFFNRGAHETR